jgi:hypothetical protein
MEMPIAGDKRAADLPRRFFVGVKAVRRDGDQGPEALGHGTPLWQPPRQPCARSSSTYEVIEIHKYYAQIGSEFTLVNDSPGGQQFLPTPPASDAAR